DIYQLIM
nr:Chain B, Human metapneumovirus P C-terminal region [Human metapneumovirus A]8PDQ_B Chain B, Human metapneumovirus P C-terminal region [Human metapneumovirus A]8PDS_B Chain B, Human metapneumovirus P C-terminal region [Human metapneumovirus A]8PDS_D Chain D, Human metapneumovirus P C-terminal region [Human metapneumovirus A]